MNHQQKMEALVDTQVFVQPSKYEQGIAHTSIEALLCNTPIVATSKNGAAEDFVKMKAAKLVDFNDTSSMVTSIEESLKRTPEIEENVQNGKEYILKNLDLKQTVLNFISYYNQVKV
jgi:glycosyltransferase involved in cell wall biosynthesis